MTSIISLEKAGFPSWVDAFRHTDEDYRAKYKEAEINGLINFSNEFDKDAGEILMKELSKNSFIGLTSNLYFIPEHKKEINVLKFTSANLLYFLKNFPAMVVAGRNIDSYIKDKVENFKNMPLWVKVFKNSSSQEKHNQQEILLEGIRRYKRKNESDNEAGERIYTTLLSDEVIFLGFGLITSYFFVKGGENQNYIMVHDHGGATLIYKYKCFPAYLITSPSLRWNDSHIKSMKDNQYRDEVLGITD